MGNTKKLKKLFSTCIFICFFLVLFRPFIASQLATKGAGYLGYNMYKDAIRQYKKALILDPKNSEIMNWLGYAYKGIGKINIAIDTYKKAIEINPKNTEANHDLGMIYAVNKEFRTAKEYFSRASSIPQENTHYYRMS
ncbi:MAG: tetratricopeptide repeat protein, partial [Candidatus Omnitrophica bacterium]|nr:tetratricopeptide repeat protein [Candidatus Omnitrophota bacterium]